MAKGARVLSLFLNLDPSKEGQVDQFVTHSKHYGKQVDRWNGVDVNVNQLETHFLAGGNVERVVKAGSLPCYSLRVVASLG